MASYGLTLYLKAHGTLKGTIGFYNRVPFKGLGFMVYLKAQVIRRL